MHPTERDIRIFDCEICGRVNITDQAIGALTAENKALLSGITRRRTDRRQTPVDILSTNIETLVSQANIPQTIGEKLDLILQYIAGKSGFLGQGHQFDPHKDYPIAYSSNQTEFRYLLNQLKSQGYVEFPVELVSVLTPKGWDRVNALRTHPLRSDQAFIAMWFTAEMEKYYSEGIEQAIRTCGYRPLRVDKLEHNGKICDAIVAEIRRSAFLVADFTGHRGGVYFEAGYAMGLGIPVIWLCKESDINDAHFDTRQYNHILWNNEKELFEKLRNRIDATVSKAQGNGS
jgi:nucleoside 2-deoxyribosyltransferase